MLLVFDAHKHHTRVTDITALHAGCEYDPWSLSRPPTNRRVFTRRALVHDYRIQLRPSSIAVCDTRTWCLAHHTAPVQRYAAIGRHRVERRIIVTARPPGDLGCRRLCNSGAWVAVLHASHNGPTLFRFARPIFPRWFDRSCLWPSGDGMHSGRGIDVCRSKASVISQEPWFAATLASGSHISLHHRSVLHFASYQLQGRRHRRHRFLVDDVRRRQRRLRKVRLLTTPQDDTGESPHAGFHQVPKERPDEGYRP